MWGDLPSSSSRSRKRLVIVVPMLDGEAGGPDTCIDLQSGEFSILPGPYETGAVG